MSKIPHNQNKFIISDILCPRKMTFTDLRIYAENDFIPFRSKTKMYLIVQQMVLLFFTVLGISLQILRGNNPDVLLPGPFCLVK